MRPAAIRVLPVLYPNARRLSMPVTFVRATAFLSPMHRMLWPRIPYWVGFALTAFGLLYALTGWNGSTALLAKTYTQTGGAMFAILGVVALMAGKAWMDAVVRARFRMQCSACNQRVDARTPHCHACGAPQRTTLAMLQALAASSRPAMHPSVCAGCGTNSGPNAAFCRNCGRAVVPRSEPLAA
jgi:double zinc ribbon protein